MIHVGFANSKYCVWICPSLKNRLKSAQLWQRRWRKENYCLGNTEYFIRSVDQSRRCIIWNQSVSRRTTHPGEPNQYEHTPEDSSFSTSSKTILFPSVVLTTKPIWYSEENTVQPLKNHFAEKENKAQGGDNIYKGHAFIYFFKAAVHHETYRFSNFSM